MTDNSLASPVVDATVSKTLDPPVFLPPANKVCEGYVFTVFVCPQGGGLCPRGVCVQEGSLSRGRVSVWGVSVQGKGLCRGGLCPGVGGLCRRYASYWNAFLCHY